MTWYDRAPWLQLTITHHDEMVRESQQSVVERPVRAAVRIPPMQVQSEVQLDLDDVLDGSRSSMWRGVSVARTFQGPSGLTNHPLVSSFSGDEPYDCRAIRNVSMGGLVDAKAVLRGGRRLGKTGQGEDRWRAIAHSLARTRGRYVIIIDDEGGCLSRLVAAGCDKDVINVTHSRMQGVQGGQRLHNFTWRDVAGWLRLQPYWTELLELKTTGKDGVARVERRCRKFPHVDELGEKFACNTIGSIGPVLEWLLQRVAGSKDSSALLKETGLVWLTTSLADWTRAMQLRDGSARDVHIKTNEKSKRSVAFDKRLAWYVWRSVGTTPRGYLRLFRDRLSDICPQYFCTRSYAAMPGFDVWLSYSGICQNSFAQIKTLDESFGSESNKLYYWYANITSYERKHAEVFRRSGFSRVVHKDVVGNEHLREDYTVKFDRPFLHAKGEGWWWQYGRICGVYVGTLNTQDKDAAVQHRSLLDRIFAPTRDAMIEGAGPDWRDEWLANWFGKRIIMLEDLCFYLRSKGVAYDKLPSFVRGLESRLSNFPSVAVPTFTADDLNVIAARRALLT